MVKNNNKQSPTSVEQCLPIDTSTPKSGKIKTQSSNIKISPSKSIAPASKVGRQRVATRSTKRKFNSNSQSDSSNTSLNKSGPKLTDEDTIVLENIPRYIDLSPKNRKEDIFYQAEVAEKLALATGQIIPTIVRSLPIPEIKIHKEGKNKPNKNKKHKIGNHTEPVLPESTQVWKSSVIGSDGNIRNITTANIKNSNIQNITMSVMGSSLDNTSQDTGKEEDKEEDRNRASTAKDLDSMLLKMQNFMKTEISKQESKLEAKIDAKLAAVTQQVIDSTEEIKKSNVKLEKHIADTNQQSHDFRKSLEFLEGNHNDLYQNQKYITNEVKDLRFKLDNVVAHIENEKRKKEKITESSYKNMLMLEIKNAERKFKMKGYPYDRNENWNTVEIKAKEIINCLQQRSNTQEQIVDLNTIQLRKKTQYALEFEIHDDNPKDIRNQLLSLNRFVNKQANDFMKDIQIQEEIPEPYRERYYEIRQKAMDWKSQGPDRQFRLQFEDHNLVMNVRYNKDTAYHPYKFIEAWAPPTTDYNEVTGQWKRREREKQLPDNEIESLHDEELRTIKIEVPEESDKENIKKYMNTYEHNVKDFNASVLGMVLLRYENENQAKNFVEKHKGQAMICGKTYAVSRCGIYELSTDKTSLSKGPNVFVQESPVKTTNFIK